MTLSEIISRLSSQNSQKDRDEAIKLLYSQLGATKVLIMPEEGMSCWKNAANVLKIIGRPYIDPAIPGMFCWLRDMTYPGYDVVYRILKDSLPKRNLAEYLEIAANKAISQGDKDWFYNLSNLCFDASLLKKDFLDEKVYLLLKRVNSGENIEMEYKVNNEYDEMLKREVGNQTFIKEDKFNWKVKRKILRY